jgi:hypothetical protein
VANAPASYAFFGRISRSVGSVSRTDSCKPVMGTTGWPSSSVWIGGALPVDVSIEQPLIPQWTSRQLHRRQD